MRTNIVIDDELMMQAQELTGIQTKKGVVEEALRLLVRMKEQARIKELRGQLTWEGDLNSLREGRFESID